MAADSHKELQKSVTFGNWVRKDIQYSQFQNYELTYAHFVRFPTPFSWEIWQPGSSPGNTWNLVKSSGNRLLIFRRDANPNIFVFSKLFLSIQISLTTITSIFTTQSIKVHDMITFLIKTSPYCSNQYNTLMACFIPTWKLVTIFKYFKNCHTEISLFLELIYLSKMNINILKDNIQIFSIEFPKHKISQPKFVKSHIQKNPPSYNQIKNQMVFYEHLCLYITLCSLTINNLLNFKILVYQIIQMKLITSSWWRDKISWYFSLWDYSMLHIWSHMLSNTNVIL